MNKYPSNPEKPTFRTLFIYQESLELFFAVHRKSLHLPAHERYELGSQIRRAADSVNSNIVEGYGRKRYRHEYLKFLTYSHASAMEVTVHLEKIAILYPDLKEQMEELVERYNLLGIRIHHFIRYVETQWRSEPRDDTA